jgi:hypothetical protein
MFIYLVNDSNITIKGLPIIAAPVPVQIKQGVHHSPV